MKKDFELEYYKTENEKLKLELEIEKTNNKMSPDMMSEINEIVQFASEMRAILQECRYEQINMGLAKKIDYILRRAKDFD
jgi:hypothetical protein